MKMLLSGKQGYGVKTMTDRERIYNLVDKVCEYATWALELKQENSELKKRVAELEKPKKKHKFRAMTNSEFCGTYACDENFDCEDCSLYRQADVCELSEEWKLKSEKPYKSRNGKYILIEVKE